MRATLVTTVFLVACAGASSPARTADDGAEPPARGTVSDTEAARPSAGTASDGEGRRDLRSVPDAALHGRPCASPADCGALSCTSWQRDGAVCRIPCSPGDLCPSLGGVIYTEGEEHEPCADDGHCPIGDPEW